MGEHQAQELFWEVATILLRAQVQKGAGVREKLEDEGQAFVKGPGEAVDTVRGVMVSCTGNGLDLSEGHGANQQTNGLHHVCPPPRPRPSCNMLQNCVLSTLL